MSGWWFLARRFADDGEALDLIEREADLARSWIAETEESRPKVSSRTFGDVDSSDEAHGTRSIFDDIDKV